jgi:shikimate 5-dehydrogenase
LDAESIGARTMTGLDMFIHQALAAQELWLGEAISNRVNFDDLKQYIESNLC